MKNFKQYFETKVIEYEKPLLMYHGGSYSGGEFKGTGWFTRFKEDAEYYVKQNNGILTKAYLIIKNPLYTGDIKHLKIKPTKEMLDSVEKRRLQYSLIIENNIITFIEANAGVMIAIDIGKDGVIDLQDKKILDAVIFKSSQIISV